MVSLALLRNGIAEIAPNGGNASDIACWWFTFEGHGDLALSAYPLEMIQLPMVFTTQEHPRKRGGRTFCPRLRWRL